MLLLQSDISSTSYPPTASNLNLLQQLLNTSFQYTTGRNIIVEEFFSPDSKLTLLCMEASEQSLAKDWANEDDTHWESFLK